MIRWSHVSFNNPYSNVELLYYTVNIYTAVYISVGRGCLIRRVDNLESLIDSAALIITSGYANPIVFLSPLLLSPSPLPLT